MATEAGLVLPNLLNDLSTLNRLLETEVANASWLDSFLLAAGMAQIADDYLRPEINPFDRAAAHLGGSDFVGARLAGKAAAGIASTARTILPMLPARRRAMRWRRDLGGLLDRLAEASLEGGAPPAQTARLIAKTGIVTRRLGGLPLRMRRRIIRMPACFHGFDQQPSDIAQLVHQFAMRWPERTTPLLVLGVRTSGSYLAPLAGALLREAGYHDVRVLAIRPGRGLSRDERMLFASFAEAGGRALLMDDPPLTGGTIARTAAELERAGVARDSIVLLLQTLAGTTLPPKLSGYDAVILPSDRWAVIDRLTVENVEETLSRLTDPQIDVTVSSAHPLPGAKTSRGHLKALFAVRFRDLAAGEERQRMVLVEGVGLGYFGRQELGVARALEKFAPLTYGLEAGLLYREWLPDKQRIGAEEPAREESVAAPIATYVTERSLALPVAEDVSLRYDDEPAWEVASSLLSRAFARAWPLAKVLLTDRAVKRILHVERPSVVDGNTDLRRWFDSDGPDGSLRKVDVGDQRYANLCLRCCDPVFDLAGASARSSASFAGRLRAAYEDQGNEPIEPERWLLYELAHLHGWQRTQPEQKGRLQRARSRVLQRYFADVYLADLAGSGEGPVCALDIDGVLETGHLGFPALSPASALALRALIAHDFRPVLVSGRSLDEVAERCQAYGLVGGVAEYGSALYESSGDGVRELISGEEAAALARLRDILAATNGISIDPDFSRSVRASRVVRGQRVGIDPDATEAVLAQVEGIRAIEGESQTDCVIDRVGKGSGLRALVTRLNAAGSDSCGEVALAAGDTPSDLPMATVASRAVAPAHAHPSLRENGFEIMRLPYQAGLAKGVARLIGHDPGGCEACRMAESTPEREIVLTALGAQERGAHGIIRQAAKLAYVTWRAGAPR